MRDQLTAHSIANTVRMSRTQHKGAFLVLEGDTDARLFKRFTDSVWCRIMPAFGKDMALKVLEILNKEKFPGVLVVVDAEFWHVEGKALGVSNLLVTDTHDLETMILKSSDCLDRLLDEYGKWKILEALETSVIDMLLEGARPVGYLRWLCQQDGGLRIRFRDLDVESIVEVHSLKIHPEKLLKSVMAQCVTIEDRDGMDTRSLKSNLNKLMKKTCDLWQICNGHDIMKILAVGLRKFFGNPKAKNLCAEQVESNLRMAYDYGHFQQTNLFLAILKWQTENSPYTIFKP